MQSLIDVTLWRVHYTHQMKLEVAEKVTEEQFCWVPGPEAPPIGWHLWHMARWADRIQAAWATEEGAQEIWEKEQLAYRWEVDRAALGTLEAGMSMEHEAACRLVQDVGKERILDYTRRSFAACDEAMDRLRPDDFDTRRTSVKAYRITEDRRVVEATPPQATVASEVLFHLHHGSRHLGMIEGLLGAQGVNGTASA